MPLTCLTTLAFFSAARGGKGASKTSLLHARSEIESISVSGKVAPALP